MPSLLSFPENKIKKNKSKIRKIKENKIKIVSIQMSMTDKDVVRVVEKMKKAGVKELQGDEWKIEGDLVIKEGKIYVSKDEELRVEVI